MPELARFYGIVIAIYGDEPEHRYTPHIHAYVGGKGRRAEHRVVIAIRSRKVLAGSLPARYLQLVLAWAVIHENELLDAWDTVMRGGVPNKITPLK